MTGFVLGSSLISLINIWKKKSLHYKQLYHFIKSLYGFQAVINHRIRAFESRIKKLLSEQETEITRYKEVLNNVTSLIEEINTYLQWEEWLYNTVMEQLDDQQKQKLAERYNEENAFNPGFIDLMLEDGYRDYYFFIEDLKSWNVDFKHFYETKVPFYDIRWWFNTRAKDRFEELKLQKGFG